MRIQAPAHEPASSTADNDLQQARQTLGRLQPRPDQINAVPGSVQITKILPNPE